MALTTRKVLKYTLLPGIIPRLREFTATGFYHIALYMSLAFACVGLLPRTHPYLNPANAGRYGIRHVLAQARRNLIFSREHADQVIIYYTIMLGVFLVFLQVIFLVLSLAVHGAAAATPAAWYSNFLATPNPAGDIAFITLDHVFGFQGVFGSCVDPAAAACPAILANMKPDATWPTPLHTALHSFFNFYNLGVAVVGFVIFLYLIMTVVGETAQTGKPFGRRFSHWTAVRLVLAVFLIAPLTDGMNGAQILTMHVVKWGSGLGTNGWIKFNETIANSHQTVLGMPDNMVFSPTPPGANAMLQFMLVAKTCMYAEQWVNQRTIKAYQVYGDDNPPTDDIMWPMPADFTKALTNSANHDIILRFGEYDVNKYPREKGFVKPYCGEMTINVTDLSTPGAYTVESAYYKMLVDRWNDPDNDAYGKQIAQKTLPVAQKDPSALLPDNNYITASKKWFLKQTTQAALDGRAAQQSDPNWMKNFTQLGWAGAPIWYNKIAEYNGSLVSSVYNLPTPSHYPIVMENVKEERTKHNNFVSNSDTYSPYLSDRSLMFFPNKGDINIAVALYTAQTMWQDQTADTTGSPVEDTIKSLFGLNGIYDLMNNKDVHPLAQLAGIGRSLMETCAMNLGIAVGAGVTGSLLQMSSNATLASAGHFASGIGSFMLSIAMICMAIGFILFYVIPFMPFVYFFFAFGGWIRAIFEAMVGMPLWGLSFVRIDGEGLIGHDSADGLYLLLEIFLRPIMIVFGLIASIAIFSAQAMVLSQIWTILMANITGGDPSAVPPQAWTIDYIRSAFDGFFFTVMYAMIIYMLGMASFKMIDFIPTHIMSWIGGGSSPFGVGEDAGKAFMSEAQSRSQQVQSGFGKGLQGLLNRPQ